MGDVSRSTELWPLTGLFVAGADLHRRVQRGGMFHRRNSPVRRNDHDGCLVPQGHKPGRRSPPGGHLDSKGHKLGRNDVHGRVPNAPSGAKHHRLPQLSLSKLRKFMASDKCPIPISGLPSRSATVLATLRILS